MDDGRKMRSLDVRNTEIIQALWELRTQFGGRRRQRKKRLLADLAKQPLNNAQLLRRYHDTLLFISAYPDDAEIGRFVSRELRRIGNDLRQSSRSGSNHLRRRLKNTGICGTDIVYSFTLPMTQWMTKNYPRHLELDWQDDSAGEALDEFLTFLTPSLERDGLLSERLSTRQWFRLAKGGRRLSDLAWLISLFMRLDASPEVREQAFDSLELSMRWLLSKATATRSLARFPPRPILYHCRALQRTISLGELMSQPLPATRRLPIEEANRLLDVCRVTLCVRQREIDPLTYVNPREVILFRLERGIDVALFGMSPSRRLPIESYFGFVAARNRVPVGYGGGWVLGDRCEIGVNVFDEFRGGESACIFGQVMRVFHQYLGGLHFVVDPYQFGAGNTEAIRSGAYWFYDRLGFRPTDGKLLHLADTEREKRSADRFYRSSAGILRRLAGSKLFFNHQGAKASPWSDIVLSDIGIAVTRWIGGRFDGDRAAAECWAWRRAVRDVNVRGLSKWPSDQQASFRRMSLLLGPIADIRSWTVAEKKEMVSIMRAKGGVSQRTYARKIRRSQRFLSVLLALARDD